MAMNEPVVRIDETYSWNITRLGEAFGLLYSRRIVGWYIDKRMTTDLVIRALEKAYHLRQPSSGIVFYIDRGSQYTSRRYRKLLARYNIRPIIRFVYSLESNK